MRSRRRLEHDSVWTAGDVERTHSFREMQQGGKVHNQLVTLKNSGYTRLRVTIPGL